MQSKPRVLFVGSTYAGHRTRFENLQDHIKDVAHFDATFVEISGWQEGGRLERLSVVPQGIKGRGRSAWEARSLARMPRPDVIWTSAADVAPLYLWANAGPLHAPLIFDTDASYKQLNLMAPEYFNREPSKGLAFNVRARMEKVLLQRATVVTPWSRWARQGLIEAGLPESRVRVIPPGVDLAKWMPPSSGRPIPGLPLRLLFVGGNFARKGGDLLLEAVSGPLRGLVELDIVTRDSVPRVSGVEVHRAEANTPELKELYGRADVFVLPTRAECFGIASVEALASGLPVVVSDLGGARDIVDDGRNGWLIEPTVDSLSSCILALASDTSELRRASVEARLVAEERFDAKRQHAQLVGIIQQVIDARRS